MTTASATVPPPLPPALSDEGGWGSPEGCVVAAACTRGKGQVPRPGGPPIYGGQRHQRRQQKRPQKGGVDEDETAATAAAGPYGPSL